MSEPKPLYVKRNVLNAQDIISHYKAQGFSTLTTPEDMHVTIAYSRKPVVWDDMGDDLFGDADGHIVVPENDGPRVVTPLGDEGAVVMKFQNTALTVRHNQMKRDGASWDYPSYMPHVTITYNGEGVDLDSVEPWQGSIVLGPEVFEDLQTDWSENREEADDHESV